MTIAQFTITTLNAVDLYHAVILKHQFSNPKRTETTAQSFTVPYSNNCHYWHHLPPYSHPYWFPAAHVAKQVHTREELSAGILTAIDETPDERMLQVAAELDEEDKDVQLEEEAQFTIFHNLVNNHPTWSDQRQTGHPGQSPYTPTWRESAIPFAQTYRETPL